MKAPAPTKGVVPRMDGVAGILVSAIPSDVVFGDKRFRQSPYDPLLQQLKTAGPGNYLRFEDLRARVSLTARAKKLGIKVLFGEQGTTLWVALAEAETSKSGTVEEPPRKSNAELVLEAIAAKRHTPGEITTWLRSNGVPGIGITQVDGLLFGLLGSGKVKSKPIREGSDQPERWMLA